MTSTSQVTQIPVITIDGPSGSGKGTVSRRVANELGWHFLDSGSLYRLAGLSALKNKVNFDDAAALASVTRLMDVRFEMNPGINSGVNDASDEARIFLANEDVSLSIRTEESADAASRVAAVPEVREALLSVQRSFCKLPGLVADGRDMGTTIFPTAAVKIFLIASAEERAERRYKQLKEKGIDVSLSSLLVDIKQRDERDTGRGASPLVKSADALLLDSTKMTIEEVVNVVLAKWHASAAIA